MDVKPGQVWINTGFEAAYKTRFFCAVVRVLKVVANEVTVRSLSDNGDARFGYGGPTNEPFTIEKTRFIPGAQFRPCESGDIKKFVQNRKVHRILYGEID